MPWPLFCPCVRSPPTQPAATDFPLALALTAQGGRREVAGLEPDIVGAHWKLVVESQRDIAPRLQIGVYFERWPDQRLLVVVDDVAFGDPPELVAVVVDVHQHDLPGVFIHVQGAPLVDVGRALLQRCLHYPDPVQLVAQVLRVDVQGVEDLVEGKLAAVQLVGVVRHVDLALADEPPVVPVDRPVEHVELIGGAQPVRGSSWVVVGDVRGAPHPTLTRVVGPGVTGLANLVHGLIHQQQIAREPRRRQHLLLEQDHGVVEPLLGHARQRVAEFDLKPVLDHGIGAAAGDRGLTDDAFYRLAPVAQQVVPDYLQAAGRDRERNAHRRPADAVAAVHQPCGGCDLAGGVVDPLRGGGATPGGVDRDPKRWIGLQHALVPDRELVAVRVEVGRGDDEEWLVTGKGVAVVLAEDVAGRWLSDAAGPLRDGAFGVARPLSSEWGEVAAEPCDLVSRGLSGGGKGEGAPEDECCGGSKGRCLHGHGT